MKKFAVILAFMVVSVCSFGQSAHLKGRSVVGPLPYPDYDFKKSGTVVVDIWVDNYGNVAKAQAGAEGTTLTSRGLLNSARNAAMRAHFNQKANAPALQQGTITYIFSYDRIQGKVDFADDSTIEERIDENSLKFLGIPVDGSRESVIAQLKEKGFDGSVWSEYLEGQFNGEPVRVYVHTYRDKVDRIIVDFDHVPEMNLNEQYNHLLSLLVENEKYVPLGTYSPIPPEENCETEIFLNKKDYKARFSYVSPNGHEESEGEVWLSILNRRGNRVCLYYDNLNNRPQGEDL